MVKVRWVTRFGMPMILISVGGDEFLCLLPDTSWELVHKLTSALETGPAKRAD